MDRIEKIERQIVRKLIKELANAGFLPDTVWDGGEYVEAHTEKAVLDAVFSVGVSTIHFDRGEGSNGKSHGVCIVCGNGQDCLSDWHVSDRAFDTVMSSVSDWVSAQDMHS